MTPEFFTLQEVVAGRYSLVREIGRGGMGIVFLARDVALDRPVAIKLLPPMLASSREHRERFVREARIAARLTHPHIVPIHAVEEHDSLVFFVMAFIDGETLGERVARAGALSPREAMRIVQEVAWALDHAHAHGVVHRDVKPDNILIDRGSGRAMVTDFGIARAGDATDTTGEGRIVGTPKYMSPEQANGLEIGPASDIYSLGAVAFHALTGRPPFEADSAIALLARHVSEPAPPISSIRRDVPPRLAAAIDRCLAKTPAERFASAEELAFVLRSADAGAAQPPGLVRAFAREVDAAGGEMASTVAIGVTSAALLGYTLVRASGVSFPDSLDYGFKIILFGGVAAAAAALTLMRFGQFVSTARELLRAGYGFESVRPALAAQAQERAADGPGLGTRPTSVGILVRVALMVAALRISHTDGPMQLVGAAAALAIPTLALRQLLSDKSGTSWWTRAMQGRLGRFVFRVARVGMKDRQPATPAPGESTALAIGNAAGDLFAALPPAVQRQFADVPALVARLEADALALRDRGADGVPDPRFTQAVAALESLRLDLLRMQTAVDDTGGLTRDIEAAKRIGDDIATQLAARDELERL